MPKVNKNSQSGILPYGSTRGLKKESADFKGRSANHKGKQLKWHAGKEMKKEHAQGSELEDKPSPVSSQKTYGEIGDAESRKDMVTTKKYHGKPGQGHSYTKDPANKVGKEQDMSTARASDVNEIRYGRMEGRRYGYSIPVAILEYNTLNKALNQSEVKGAVKVEFLDEDTEEPMLSYDLSTQEDRQGVEEYMQSLKNFVLNSIPDSRADKEKVFDELISQHGSLLRENGKNKLEVMKMGGSLLLTTPGLVRLSNYKPD